MTDKDSLEYVKQFLDMFELHRDTRVNDIYRDYDNYLEVQATLAAIKLLHPGALIKWTASANHVVSVELYKPEQVVEPPKHVRHRIKCSVVPPEELWPEMFEKKDVDK
jgi:hypothetical protein